jgi:cytochrome c oxidase assembly factor CtaG
MDMALTHWSANWPVLAGYAVVVTAHLTGLSRTLASGPRRPAGVAGARPGQPQPGQPQPGQPQPGQPQPGQPQPGQPQPGRQELVREALLFQAGLLAVLLALVSPVGYWSAAYLWVRAVQELTLAFIGPGLMVVGAPWPALRQGLRRAASTGGPAQASGAGQPGGADGQDRPARIPWLLARPLAAVAAFNLLWLGWHLPALFDLAKTSSAGAVAEHACYLCAGIVFWLQLVGSRPFSPAAPPLRRASLLVGTVVAGTVLGMVLVFGSSVLYPVYGGAAHHVMTVLDDQQLSGAVLWMGMLPPLIIAAVALLLRWLSDEESAELSADLDRLLTRRSSSWPSRPGVR